MTEHYRAQHLLIRAIMALCDVAAESPEDVRSELHDQVAWGLHEWMESPVGQRALQLRTWCDDTAGLMDRMASSGNSFARAQLALLRFRASLGVPMAVPTPSAKPKPPVPASVVRSPRRPNGPSQRRLLQAVKQSGPIRSRDLITMLSGQLSDRTVKRSLKDLTAAGLVRRVEGEEGVVYEAVVENT